MKKDEKIWLIKIKVYSFPRQYDENDNYAEVVFQLEVTPGQNHRQALSMFDKNTLQSSKSKPTSDSKGKHLSPVTVSSDKTCLKNAKKIWVTLVLSTNVSTMDLESKLGIIHTLATFFGLNSQDMLFGQPSDSSVLQKSTRMKLVSLPEIGAVSFIIGCGSFNPSLEPFRSIIHRLDVCLLECQERSSTLVEEITIEHWIISREDLTDGKVKKSRKRKQLEDNDIFFVFSSRIFPSSSSQMPFSAVLSSPITPDGSISIPILPPSTSDLGIETPQLSSRPMTSSFITMQSVPSSSETVSLSMPIFLLSSSSIVIGAPSSSVTSDLSMSILIETPSLTPSFSFTLSTSTVTVSTVDISGSIGPVLQPSSSVLVLLSSSEVITTTSSAFESLSSPLDITSLPVTSSTPFTSAIQLFTSTIITEPSTPLPTSILVLETPSFSFGSVTISNSFLTETESSPVTSFVISEISSDISSDSSLASSAQVFTSPELSLSSSAQVFPSPELSLSSSAQVFPSPELSLSSSAQVFPSPELSLSSSAQVFPSPELSLSSSAQVFPSPELSLSSSVQILPSPEASDASSSPSTSDVEPTPSFNFSLTLISSVTSIPKPSSESTSVPQATSSPFASPELSPSPSASPEPSPSPSASPEPSPSPSASPEPSPSPSASSEPSPSPSASSEPSPSPSASPEPSPLPSASPEPSSPSASPVLSPSPSASSEPSPSPSVLPEPSPSPSASPEPSPSPSASPEPSPSPSASSELSPSPSASSEPSPSPSASPEPSPSPSASPEPSSPSASPVLSPSPSASSEPSPSPSVLPEPSPSPSVLPEPSPSPSASPKLSPSPSASSEPSPSTQLPSITDMSSSTELSPSPSSSPSSSLPLFTSSSLSSLIVSPSPSLLPSPSAIPSPNVPPELVNPLPLLQLREGEALTYLIPETTFTDAEDGPTSNLSLALLNNNGIALEDNSWIELNGLYILGLWLDSIDVLTERTFILTAIDSSGDFTTSFLSIIITPVDPNGFNVTISTEGVFAQFLVNTSQQVEIVGLIAKGHNVIPSEVRILGVAEGSITVTYTSFTISGYDCYEQLIWFSFAQRTDGTYNQTFLELFSDLYTLIGAPVFKSLCMEANYTLDPTIEPTDAIIPTFNNDLSIFLAVMVTGCLIAVFLLCLAIIACCIYRRRAPIQKAIQASRDGNTYLQRSPILFNFEVQEITGERRSRVPIHLGSEEGPPGSASERDDLLPPESSTPDRSESPPPYQLPPDEYYGKYDIVGFIEEH